MTLSHSAMTLFASANRMSADHQETMANIIQPDIHYAYCEVLYRVAIQIRAFPDIERKIVHGLMEATHNIPLFLQSGNPDHASQIQCDIDMFDTRFSTERHFLSLRQIFDDAISEFASGN